MPEGIEKRLRMEGIKKGLKGKDLDAYVYGTMRNKLGWKPNNQKEKAMSDSTKKEQTAVSENKQTPAPVKKMKFTDAQYFVAKKMGFADNTKRMTDIFGLPSEEDSSGMETPPATPAATTEVPPVTPEVTPPAEETPAAPMNPAQDKIDAIKAIVGIKDIDKGIKKEGEDMISRLEEFKKLLEDADKFINTNQKNAGAFAEGEKSKETTPAA